MSGENLIIANANKKMKAGDYEAALSVYEEFVKKHPEFSPFLKFNLDICNKKIILKNKKNERFSEGSDFNNECDVVRRYLNEPIKGDGERLLPQASDLLSLIDTINQGVYTFKNLRAVIICAQSSPFQKHLLFHLLDGVRKLGLEFILDEDVEKFRFNLRCILNLIRSRSYYVKYRSKASEIFDQFTSDPRAIDLISLSEMDDISVESINHYRYTWKERKTLQKLPQNFSNKTEVYIGTILLNESKFIGLNLIQHYNLCDRWTLVEGACQGYPEEKVTQGGLSLDNSAKIIQLFPDVFNKIRFIQHGWTAAKGEDAKCELRNLYLKYCTGGLLWVLDADEFYKEQDVIQILNLFKNTKVNAVTVPQMHLWKTFGRFIVGGYYDVSHTRFFRVQVGMRYLSNHNFPEFKNVLLSSIGNFKVDRKITNFKSDEYTFENLSCFHLGFAKDYDDMRDKTKYYLNRGEAVTRKATTESRAAWFNDKLPEACKVYQRGGLLPNILEVTKERFL